MRGENKDSGYYNGAGSLGMVVGRETRIRVLHNDNRQKKELPNGKIIMTVAETSWQLVYRSDKK